MVAYVLLLVGLVAGPRSEPVVIVSGPGSQPCGPVQVTIVMPTTMTGAAAALLRLEDVDQPLPPSPSAENVSEQRLYIRGLLKDRTFREKHPQEFHALLFACYGGLFDVLGKAGTWDAKLAQEAETNYGTFGDMARPADGLYEIAQAAQQAHNLADAVKWQRRYVEAEQWNRPGEAVGYSDLLHMCRAAGLVDDARTAALDCAAQNHDQPGLTLSAALTLADMGEWELSERILEIGDQVFEARVRELERKYLGKRVFVSGTATQPASTEREEVVSQGDSARGEDLKRRGFVEKTQDIELQIEEARKWSVEMHKLFMQWKERLPEIRKRMATRKAGAATESAPAD